MPTIVALLTRRDGMSVEEFRRYYEEHHAPLVLSAIGTFLCGYRRSYVDPDRPDAVGPTTPIDVVTELEFADQAGLDRMVAHMNAHPHLAELIKADELAFLDTRRTRLLTVSHKGVSAIDA